MEHRKKAMLLVESRVTLDLNKKSPFKRKHMYAVDDIVVGAT